MLSITLFMLAAIGAAANQVCYLPHYDLWKLVKPDEPTRKGDVDVLCYTMTYQHTPNDPDLYKDVQCGQQYYIGAGYVSDGSYNSFSMDNNGYGLFLEYPPFTVENKDGKMRALVANAVKVSLGQEVKLSGTFCVQKYKLANDADTLSIVAYPSYADEKNYRKFTIAGEAVAQQQTKKDNKSTQKTQTRVTSNSVERNCQGQNINCSVNTQSRNSRTSIEVRGSGDASANIKVTSTGRRLLGF